MIQDLFCHSPISLAIRRAAATGSHSQVCRSSDTQNLLCAGVFVEKFPNVGNERTQGLVFMSTLKISKGYKVKARFMFTLDMLPYKCPPLH
jgi:hypothetical protein